MARIRCHYLDCVFLDDGFCSAAHIEIDPDTGCMTYSPNNDSSAEADWEEEELEEWDETEGEEEDEDDAWLDEDEEEY